MTTKPRPRVHIFEVMERAVQNGVVRGLFAANKHTEPNKAPDANTLSYHLTIEVMRALAEVVDLEEDRR